VAGVRAEEVRGANDTIQKLGSGNVVIAGEAKTALVAEGPDRIAAIDRAAAALAEIVRMRSALLPRPTVKSEEFETNGSRWKAAQLAIQYFGNLNGIEYLAEGLRSDLPNVRNACAEAIAIAMPKVGRDRQLAVLAVLRTSVSPPPAAYLKSGEERAGDERLNELLRTIIADAEQRRLEPDPRDARRASEQRNARILEVLRRKEEGEHR
jgi:hypothetical protein